MIVVILKKRCGSLFSGYCRQSLILPIEEWIIVQIYTWDNSGILCNIEQVVTFITPL